MDLQDENSVSVNFNVSNLSLFDVGDDMIQTTSKNPL